MINNFVIPSYLLDVSLLTKPVQVVAQPQVKKNEDGSPKTSAAFPNRLGYSVPVEIVKGYREKVMPSGEKVTVPDFLHITITVWSDTPLDGIKPDDYVVMDRPMVGAVNGSLFYQCLGLLPADLDELLGDE